MEEKVHLARYEWITILTFCLMFIGLVSITYEPFIPPPEGEIDQIEDTRIVEKKARKPRKTKTIKKSFEKKVNL